MTYLEGVYWDLDGTIANTELEAHLPAFNYAFNDFNLNWNWDIPTYIDLLKINGGKNRISYYSRLINKSLNNKFIIKIHERKQYHYINLVSENTCLEGRKFIKVPVLLVFPLAFKGDKALPSSNSIKYSFLSLNIFNVNFSDKALTTETPTP